MFKIMRYVAGSKASSHKLQAKSHNNRSQQITEGAR